MACDGQTQTSRSLPRTSDSVADTEDERVERRMRESRDSETNPFVVFKTFIDSNFGAVWNFPSNIWELKARMQQEKEARRQHELDTWRRWTGTTGTPDNTAMQRERASAEQKEAAVDAALELFAQASERNCHVPRWKLDALFKDDESVFGELDRFASPMLSFGGACYYMLETGDNLPSTASLFRWPAQQPRWLSIDWFKKSSYSPVQLEAHLLAGQAGTKWRAAFEDLLNATLDKPMVSCDMVGQRSPNSLPQSTYHGPGLDWMLSLQCRGILPPQIPSFYNHPRETNLTLDSKNGHSTVLKTPYRTQDVWPEVNNEWQALIDEIATPSASSPFDVHADGQPVTEQDLYDQLPKQWAQTGSRAGQTPSADWHVPTMTGSGFTDWLAVEEALFQAVKRNDSAAVGDVLDEYQSVYGETSITEEDDVGEMFLNEDKQVSKTKIEKLHRLLHDESLGGPVKPDQYNTAFQKLADRYHYFHERTEEGPPSNDDSGAVQEYQRQPSDLEQQIEERLHKVYQALGELRAEELDRQRALEQEREAMGLPAEEETPRRNVLSQLTTTQTTRLPDGTMTTKVVLKRRFADGREETTESMQTTREEQQKVEVKEEEVPKGKGWFWR